MSNPEAEVREYPSVLAVARGYGLEVTNYLATPGGYLLEAADGKYWLKPFAGSEKELSYVVAASEHLQRRGFPYLCRCLRLRDGSPGIRFRRVLFQLVEAAPGPSPELKSHEELRAAGARLAWLHLAARAFDPPPDLLDVRVEWGSCERVFKERLLDLYDFQETSVDRPRQTRFDVLYLEHFNDFVDAAREAVDIVAELPLARMIAAARAERQLCHGDFTPAALAVDQQGELVVADLEMMRFELRALDVAELIRATAECNVERAEAILAGYHAAFPLTQEDFLLVEAYLRFPREYWRAANAYYREGINARARLVEAVSGYPALRRFLDSFHRLADRFPPGGVDPTETAAEPLNAPEIPFPPAVDEPAVVGGAIPSGASDGPTDACPGVPESGPDGVADPHGSPSAPPPIRRRALEDLCLFDEPLPARRRTEAQQLAAASTSPAPAPPVSLPASPPADSASAGPLPFEPAPVEPARVEPMPVEPAPVEPASVDNVPVGAASEDVAISADSPAGDAEEPTAPADAGSLVTASSAENAPAQAPDASAAAAPAGAAAKKKIVWKFPAPLPKPTQTTQEDKK